MSKIDVNADKFIAKLKDIIMEIPSIDLFVFLLKESGILTNTSEKENSHECCRNIKPYKLWFCSDIRNHSIILFCRNMLGR